MGRPGAKLPLSSSDNNSIVGFGVGRKGVGGYLSVLRDLSALLALIIVAAELYIHFHVYRCALSTCFNLPDFCVSIFILVFAVRLFIFLSFPVDGCRRLVGRLRVLTTKARGLGTPLNISDGELSNKKTANDYKGQER